MLGGDGVYGFQTPLATLHKFNGWADKFLATPSNGLEDLYLALEGKTGRFKWATIFHDFSANEGTAAYGSELDLVAAYTTKWGQTFGVKGVIENQNRRHEISRTLASEGLLQHGGKAVRPA